MVVALIFSYGDIFNVNKTKANPDVY